jgi:hypothetical protein
MELETFEHFQDEFEKENYEKKNRTIKQILEIFSYFGHLASIFVGFFFIYKILTDAAGDELGPMIIGGISISFLVLLELLKRVIFHRSSFEIITKPMKKWTSHTLGLIFFSLSVVGISFYFGLSGALRFADKNEKIILNKDKDIAQIDSSIKLKYAAELNLMDLKLKGIEKDRNQIQKEIDQLSANIVQMNTDKSNETVSWQKVTIDNQIKTETQRRDKLKEELSLMTKSITIERDSIESKIHRDKEPLIKKLEASYIEKQKLNDTSSLKFIFIIAFIETLILGGIYFKNVYNYQSYVEQKNINKNDPSYLLFRLYTNLLTVAYQGGNLKEGDKCVSSKKVLEIARAKNPLLTDKQVSEFFTVIAYLKIVELHPTYRIFTTDLNSANKKIQDHLEIHK